MNKKFTNFLFDKVNSGKILPKDLAGIGLRNVHVEHILENISDIKKEISWFEIHSENYYNLQTKSFADLIKIRENFDISLHCVGNSFGSVQKPDKKHLQKLKNLIAEINPIMVSDHISWGKIADDNYNDLLPLPYNKESLQAIIDNINFAQDFLNRKILVENPSTYLSFKNEEMDEVDFINEITAKTGCKLLLDVNNIYVSCSNSKNENPELTPEKYIQKLENNIIGEIHLAGHYVSKIEVEDRENKENKSRNILIDTHDDIVFKDVWEIYKLAIKKFKNIPFLIEWDQNFPEFNVLINEATKAKKLLVNSSG